MKRGSSEELSFRRESARFSSELPVDFCGWRRQWVLVIDEIFGERPFHTSLLGTGSELGCRGSPIERYVHLTERLLSYPASRGDGDYPCE